MWILFLSFVLHYGTVLFFVLRPQMPGYQPQTIRSIQDQFASIVLNREAEAIIVANTLMGDYDVVSEEEIALSKERRRIMASKSSTAERDDQSMSYDIAEKGDVGSFEIPPAYGTEQSRDALQREGERVVMEEGILGVLYARRATQGEKASAGILGEESKGQKQYDRVFQNLEDIGSSGGALKTGRGTGNEKAAKSQRSRTTESGNIDQYISELGTTSTTADMERTTEYIKSGLSPLSNEGQEMEMGAVSSGARDIDEVATIVLAHNSAIQYCYERELRRNPDLKGKVAVRFTILPEGVVDNVKIISSTLNNERIERCIISRISRWDDFGAIDPSLGKATFRQVYTFGF